MFFSEFHSLAVAQVSALTPQLSPTSGQISMTLFGKNFGISTSFREVLIGASSCSMVVFTSDTSVRCSTAPGWGLLQLVLMKVNGEQGFNFSSASLNFTGDLCMLFF